ncbi:MAG: hypothetical protein NZM38_05655 [Cytophagales bacterium]|nr:hypothetical protein [Cytophagales bacterium]MDW8384240.1 hypothetical protein [Flammeovirgaceae bacterium]
MKTKAFLVISFAWLVISCQKNASTQQETQQQSTTLSIESFSSFPEEITGCSCYFSNNIDEFAQQNYIYASDFEKVAFLKINGSFEKFEQIYNKKVDENKNVLQAKNQNYSIVVEMTDQPSESEETQAKSGTIQLTSKDGSTTTIPFYGECGC